MGYSTIIGRPAAAVDWRCADSGCRSLLGKKHSQGRIIVKYKDFISEISGNYTFIVTCRKCGLRNTISNQSSSLSDMITE
jgi:hypothetical protein